jgi:pimeloyl-ACP methyl ester carboxylesterase
LAQSDSAYLSNYQVVVFLDARPEDPAQRAAFQTYMEHGGAWMGFHFAAFALTPSAELMADDIGALITYLKLDRPDILGYSLGGGVALQTAVRHPAQVGKLVLVSTLLKRNAFYADILRQQGQMSGAAAEMRKQTPMYQLYASIAPRPQDFSRLLDKIGETMKQDFDYSTQVAGIKATTLIVAGDADIFPPTLAVEMFGLLGGGKRTG